MVKSKQQRRADAKRRAAQSRRAAMDAVNDLFAPSGRESAGSRHQHAEARVARVAVDITELISMGASLATQSGADDRFEAVVTALVDSDGVAEAAGRTDERFRPEVKLSTLLIAGLATLWEHGWQPSDLVHVARRDAGARPCRLAIATIGSEALVSPHRAAMPPEWADQLAALGLQPGDHHRAAAEGSPKTAPTTAVVGSWRITERLGVADAIADGLRLLGAIRRLGTLSPVAAPPSRWSFVAAHPRQPTEAGDAESGAGREKALATIRALLAKAEATTFPAEAETFAAKAQQLMTRYSIDAALIDQRHGESLAAGVRSRRIHLDNPYTKEKVQLLSTVGHINRVRVVYHDGYGMATIVGFPDDLDLTDMLFTSLLVQATRSLSDASQTIGRGASPAFRRGFWVAYAVRIGERLSEAVNEAAAEAEVSFGSSLVPVMKERDDAVDGVFKEMFQRTTPMKVRSVDAQGWNAGRTAADLAHLGSPRAPLRS